MSIFLFHCVAMQKEYKLIFIAGYGYRGDIEKINRWSTVGDACLKDLYVVCEVVECSYSR